MNRMNFNFNRLIGKEGVGQDEMDYDVQFSTRKPADSSSSLSSEPYSILLIFELLDSSSK
jgi:hypothetical protein